MVKDGREASSCQMSLPGKEAFQAWKSQGSESMYVTNSEMVSEGKARRIKLVQRRGGGYIRYHF